MSKGKVLWAARDEITGGFETENVSFWVRKPSQDGDGCYISTNKNARTFHSMNSIRFKQLFGITLKAGQCKRVKLVEVK